MKKNDIHVAYLEKEMSSYELEGKTSMLIAVDGRYKGMIAVADTIKDTAKEAITQLKADGIDVMMLTGDNERTAQTIAKQVGIDRVIAEVVPEEKKQPM